MIKIENLSYQYTNGNKVLNNLSFTIKSGEFVAVIGQNGAGKTTLLKHFNGLLKPTSGNVTVCGYDVFKTKTSDIAKHIGFLFQNPDHQIFCSTVYEEIAFGLKALQRDQHGCDRSSQRKCCYHGPKDLGVFASKIPAFTRACEFGFK